MLVVSRRHRFGLYRRLFDSYYAEHGDWIASEGFYSRKSDVVCEMLQPNVSSVYQSDGSLISGCSYVKSPYSSIRVFGGASLH